MKKTWRNKAVVSLLCAGLAASAFSDVQFKAYAADENGQIITNDANGIPDTDLYQIALEKGDSNQDGVLTVEEAENITSLQIIGKAADLTGIEKLKNLKSLWIDETNVTDISPLSSLINLQGLDFSENQVSDISALEGLRNLVSLEFSKNQVSDTSVLQNLSKLKCLHYDEVDNTNIIGNDANGIPDAVLYRIVLKECDSNHDGILTVEEAENITCLQITEKAVDLTGIEKLKNLKSLLIDGTNVSDISPLSDLTNLQSLH